MNKTKKVLIITLSLVAILSIFLTYKTYMNKPVMIDDIKINENTINKKMFGIFVEKDSYSSESDKYEIYSGTTWPSSGYEFNSTLSTCVDENGETIPNSLSINNNTVTLTTSKTAYCYIYFDKESGYDLTYTNYTFSWEAQPNASNYNVYVDNNLVTNISTTSIEQWKLYQSSGNHIIRIDTIDINENVLNSSNDYLYNVLTYTNSYILNTNLNIGDNNVDFMRTLDYENSEITISNVIPNNVIYVNVIDFYNNLMTIHSNLQNIELYASSFNTGVTIHGQQYVNYLYDKNLCLDYNYCNNFSLENVDYGGILFNNDYINSYNNGSYYVLKYHKPIGEKNDSNIIGIQFITANTEPSNWELFSINAICLTSDTEIYVYDEKKRNFKKKKIKNIDYDDYILVWDFDNGCFAIAKPLWIKKREITGSYHKLEFDDGSILKIVNNHRIFNKEAGKFTPANDNNLTPIGTTTFNVNGKYTKLTKRETIYEKVEFYNVITNYHLNLFSSDILTSCRLNNMYEIKAMKFIKVKRKLNKLSDFKTISKKYFDGFRLAEQPLDINRDGGSLKYNDLEEYINNVLKKGKK